VVSGGDELIVGRTVVKSSDDEGMSSGEAKFIGSDLAIEELRL